MYLLRFIAFLVAQTLVTSFLAFKATPVSQGLDTLRFPTRFNNKLISNRRTRISASEENENDQSKENTPKTPADELVTTLRGTCIYFVGMMGSGKTTVGDTLAKKLRYRFIDMDEIAEGMIEMPISDYFAQGKESEFRELEYQILMTLSQYIRIVVSTGGGTVMKNLNWGSLQHGIVVYLETEPELIFERLSKSETEIKKRPLLQESDPLQKLKDILEEREDKYKAADVHVKVEAGQNPDEIAENVISSVITFIKENPARWQTWKREKDARAIGQAAMVNPVAVAGGNSGSGKGFGKTDGGIPPGIAVPKNDEESGGSIKYVKLSDIKSGKVKLPNSNDNSN